MERILVLFRKVGMTYDTETAADEHPTWDGEKAYLRNTRMDPSNVIHELAHWLVAAPERRACPNFGLGPDPDSAIPTIRTIPTYDEAQLEENQASLLGIAIEAYLGLNFQHTMVYHQWEASSNEWFCHNFWTVVQELQTKGLLVDNVPTIFSKDIQWDCQPHFT